MKPVILTYALYLNFLIQTSVTSPIYKKLEKLPPCLELQKCYLDSRLCVVKYFEEYLSKVNCMTKSRSTSTISKTFEAF